MGPGLSPLATLGIENRDDELNRRVIPVCRRSVANGCETGTHSVTGEKEAAGTTLEYYRAFLASSPFADLMSRAAGRSQEVRMGTNFPVSPDFNMPVITSIA